jgi:hypothetical protein
MNREGAETYLRLLGESELREPLVPAVPQAWSGGPAGSIARMIAVAQALIAVGALDTETARDILGNFELAAGVRRAQGTQGARSGAVTRPGAIRFAGGTRGIAEGVLRAWPARSMPGVAQPPGGVQGTEGAEGAEGAEGPLAGGPLAGGPDRFVAVGVAVPFDRGEVHLIWYTHNAAGARFKVMWRTREPGPRRSRLPGVLPIERFSAADERGGRYRLHVTAHGGPEWTVNLDLHPEPPDDIRWLDIYAPGGRKTRVSLDPMDPANPPGPPGPSDPASAPGAAPEIREAKVSPGEHLLNMLAVRLLTIAPEFPHDLRLQLAAVSPGPLTNAAAGLGHVIAALEAADVLSPLSPVPGRLAALCASLRVSGHGITAPPARDLPEPWLSLLAHYHRRKPESAPTSDGCATLAAVLPELDGVRLALLSLDNSDGSTVLNVLANGLAPDGHGAASAVDMHFSLSIWVHDSGGRWHATRPSNWHWADSECVLTLHLVPPLAESATWVDVLAVGQSAEVRVRLPLDWGYSP